jgi:hypothetical protein
MSCEWLKAPDQVLEVAAKASLQTAPAFASPKAAQG